MEAIAPQPKQTFAGYKWVYSPFEIDYRRRKRTYTEEINNYGIFTTFRSDAMDNRLVKWQKRLYCIAILHKAFV